jgi:hypothetical protein
VNTKCGTNCPDPDLGLLLYKNEIMENSAQGTIFIIDISGYSNFVKQSTNEEGARIIAQLLNAIIKANRLTLRISEIEGDAILFYRLGAALPTKAILSQFEVMLKAFNKTTRRLRLSFPQISRLSIKLITHYGLIGNFAVGGFSKLYGQALVEAHRLLKNNIGRDTYALITEEYIRAQRKDKSIAIRPGNEACELYDVGKICFTYYPYGGLFTRPSLRAIA